MCQTVGWNRRLGLMLAVAFFLRLGLAVCVQIIVSKTPDRLCLIAGDAEGYWILAGKIAAGEAYSIYDPPRKVMRTPGFPLLLAIPRMMFGDTPFAARLVLVLIGTLACGLTYWLGRELCGEMVGLVAGSYSSISPVLALFSVLFLSETAFAAAMLASLIAAAKLIRRCSLSGGTLPKRGNVITLAFLTGALVGLATYMRPTWLLVGPGLSVLIVLLNRDALRSRLGTAACLMLGLSLTLLPWTIRNAWVTQHFVPTTLWVGPSLYDGLHPGATGDSDMQFFEDDKLLQSMSEYEMDRTYRERAWAFVFANPIRVCRLALAKQARFWSPAPGSEQFKWIGFHLVAWSAFLPLLLLSLVGAWFERCNLWLLILTAAPIFYFAGLHLLFVGSLRYRLPAEYPLAVLAADGFCRWLNGSDRSSVTVPHA